MTPAIYFNILYFSFMMAVVVKARGMNFCSCFIHQWHIQRFELNYLAGLWGINLPRWIQPRDSAKFKYQAFKTLQEWFQLQIRCRSFHLCDFFSFRSALNYLLWLFRIMFYTETCINTWITCLLSSKIINSSSIHYLLGLEIKCLRYLEPRKTNFNL